MQVQDVNVIQIKSHLSEGDASHFEVTVDCDIDQEPLQELRQQLTKHVDHIEICHCNNSVQQDDGRRVMSHNRVLIAKRENVAICKDDFYAKHLKMCLYFRGGWCSLVPEEDLRFGSVCK